MIELAKKYPELIFAYKAIKAGRAKTHKQILEIQEPSIFIIEHIDRQMIKYKFKGNITIENIESFI